MLSHNKNNLHLGCQAQLVGFCIQQVRFHLACFLLIRLTQVYSRNYSSSWTPSTDPDFIDTFGIEMAEGRFFSHDRPADVKGAYVLNETAVREMGMVDPVGKSFNSGHSNVAEGPIIGIISDYQLRSLRDPIEPILMFLNPEYFNYLCLKVKATDMQATLAHVEKIWNVHSPQTPFSFRFMDEAVGDLYHSEERLDTIIRYFILLAVIMSCLGVFGLVSFMTEQRTKEIGIRKVLGASVPGIYLLLSMDFVRCVAVANLIAWPAAGFTLSRWMEGFADHADMNPWIFLAAGTTALLIALISVSWQALRAATSDLAKALRYE